jgi:PrtD family type I secretion system ABC transporter
MSSERKIGAKELRAVRDESLGLYLAVGLFTFFVNILMLAGPLYMLNVYDRVLGSRSVETLIGLSVLILFLFGMMGLLDVVRGRVMGRIAARFQSRLDERVFSASMRAATSNTQNVKAASALKDLESVQRLVGSPVLMAFFDLPFAPLFFVGIFLFHPWMGILALAGASLIIGLGIINQITSRSRLEMLNASTASSEIEGYQIRQEAELIQSLGMQGSSFSRWNRARRTALESGISANDLTGSFTASTKAFRLFLQSAMLGLGALLVLGGDLTPGAMIAGSILLGRALAPIELIVGQSALIQRAREGWGNLSELLGAVPPEQPRTSLPHPRGKLDVEQITVIPPGERTAALRMVSFSVKPGSAVGVVGLSGAGKSTLARALTGIWPPAAGKVRLDGVALDQYTPEIRGRYIGYLPQRVSLFNGTIRDNIARLLPEPDDEAVVRAAKRAGAHDMILRLPDGYDTKVNMQGGRLSGGQVQRIGLARALYGEPVLVVLDEPNSNLDNEGSAALNSAIRELREQGACILIMAHRPAAIQECDLVLMLDGGIRRAFGPKDEVMREVVQNHKDLGGAGGVS